jgi:transposase InsO family protein
LRGRINLQARRFCDRGWRFAHDAALAVAALRQAAARRGGDVNGVIFHCDCGGEYTGDQFAACCARLGVVQSMGRTGSAHDDAGSESFNSHSANDGMAPIQFERRMARVRGTPIT